MAKRAILGISIFFWIIGAVSGAGKKEAGPADPAANYPMKPIQVVVSNAPGGGPDLCARILGKYLQTELGQPLVVVNVKGAGGSIGTRQVVDSKPDGYTMNFYNEGTIFNKVSGVTDFGLEALDSAGVAGFIDTITIMSQTKKFKTFEEVIDFAVANPGKLRFGGEMGSYIPSLVATIQKFKNVSIQLVDTGGAGPSISSLAGGHVDVTCAPIGNIMDYVKSGEFTPLVFLSAERNKTFPEIPTLKSKGVDYVLPKFFYYAYPKGTPKPIIAKFSKALEKVLQNPDCRAEMERLYYTPFYMDPDTSTKYFKESEELFKTYNSYMK